jgi:hypothetical protein
MERSAVFDMLYLALYKRGLDQPHTFFPSQKSIWLLKDAKKDNIMMDEIGGPISLTIS